MAEDATSDRGLEKFQSRFGEWLVLPPGTSVDVRGSSLNLSLSPLETVDWLESQLSAAGFESLPAGAFQAIGFEAEKEIILRSWKKPARTLAEGISVAVLIRPNDSGGTQAELFRLGPETPGEGEFIIGER